MTTDTGAVADTNRFQDVQGVRDALKEVNYLADDGIAGVAFLADRLGKPISWKGLPEPARPSSPSRSPRSPALA